MALNFIGAVPPFKRLRLYLESPALSAQMIRKILSTLALILFNSPPLHSVFNISILLSSLLAQWTALMLHIYYSSSKVGDMATRYANTFHQASWDSHFPVHTQTYRYPVARRSRTLASIWPSVSSCCEATASGKRGMAKHAYYTPKWPSLLGL